MNDNERLLLAKLGIIIDSVEHTPQLSEHLPKPKTVEDVPVIVHGTYSIDDSRFRPMCQLINIVDMICESKNPAIEKTFHELVTMLHLTQGSK